jgi:hypothetical protein
MRNAARKRLTESEKYESAGNRRQNGEMRPIHKIKHLRD